AYGVAQSPDYSQLPWYSFTGYATERLIVTFAHGLMTAIAVSGLHGGRAKALAGYLTALGLHALINLGAILAALKLIPVAVSSLATYAAIFFAFVNFQTRVRNRHKAKVLATEEIVYFER
ncbi:MAG TPA: hypothetical protein VFY26_19235, partial [Anaerolineales bacterium]|nr:hypothetical protein [Anaerolineales bacterium]